MGNGYIEKYQEVSYILRFLKGIRVSEKVKPVV